MIRNNTDIGKSIKAWRKDKGLSQAELAALVGVSTSSITKYESGENRIPAEMLLDIASALDRAWFDLVPQSDDQMLDTFWYEAVMLFRGCGYDLTHLNANEPPCYSIVGNGSRALISQERLEGLLMAINSYGRFVINSYMNDPEEIETHLREDLTDGL